MQRFSMLHLAATAAFVALAACSGMSGGGAYGSGDPDLAATTPGGGPIDPFLTDGAAVRKALDAIAGKSGRPLRVTSMNADQMNGLTVEVQEPNDRVNVDEYVVAPDGTIKGPAPVQLHALGGGPVTAAMVDAQTFDPSAIGFARLAQAAREAIAKSKMPDARVFNWEIDGVGPDDKRYIFLQAARGRPVAHVKPDLTIAGMTY